MDAYHFVSEVWRGMLGLSSVPSLLFFVVVLFIPESPRWLVLRNCDERALGVFQRIYLSTQEAQTQLEETKSVVQSEAKSDWKFLLQPGIFKAVLIGAAIAILGQFMGVNAVLYYGPSIFEEAGLSGGDALFSQVLVGLVNAVTTVIAVFIIDKVGRKKLVYYGVSGMVLSLLLIGFYFRFQFRWAYPTTSCCSSSCSMYFVVPYPFRLSSLFCCPRCIPPVFEAWPCLLLVSLSGLVLIW